MECNRETLGWAAQRFFYNLPNRVINFRSSGHPRQVSSACGQVTLEKHLSTCTSRTCRSVFRVWKGILGMRDLTKIRCGNRENAKYFDGIRDLTASREAGLAKIWARDAGFICLSVGNSGNRHDPKIKRSSGQSKSTRRALNGVSFQTKL